MNDVILSVGRGADGVPLRVYLRLDQLLPAVSEDIYELHPGNCTDTALHGHWRVVREELEVVGNAGVPARRVVPRILPTVHWVDDTHPAWDERRPKVKVYRIACDFDEVIHQGTTLFTTPSEISDPPFPGAFDWIRQLLDEGLTFIVHTCRLSHWSPSNPYLFHELGEQVEEALRGWFLHHGMSQHHVDQIHFWRHVGKPSADVYIDDKAWRFHGVYPTVEELRDATGQAEVDRRQLLQQHRELEERALADCERRDDHA